MQRKLLLPCLLSGLLSGLFLSACSHSRPAIRQDDAPLRLRFAPPPGLVQHEKWIQRREVEVSFPESRSKVLEIHSGLSKETWEVLDSGGFRITTVALTASTLRNGERIEPLLSHLGIPFVFIVDSKGDFVRAEGLAQSIDALRRRMRHGPAREVLESILDPKALEESLRRGWESRFEQVCHTTLKPGDTFYRLDEQELPAGGPITSVVQQQVLGQLDGPGGDAVEVHLRVGGRRSELSREPDARRLIAELDQGALALAERVEGEGERIISANSCQTVREVLRLKGEIRLNMEAARASGATGLPERIRYRVDRKVLRGPPDKVGF